MKFFELIFILLVCYAWGAKTKGADKVTKEPTSTTKAKKMDGKKGMMDKRDLEGTWVKVPVEINGTNSSKWVLLHT